MQSPPEIMKGTGQTHTTPKKANPISLWISKILVCVDWETRLTDSPHSTVSTHTSTACLCVKKVTFFMAGGHGTLAPTNPNNIDIPDILFRRERGTHTEKKERNKNSI
jgi:hypothetical protein